MVSTIFDCLFVKNIQNKVPKADKECTLQENRPIIEKVGRSRNLMRLLKKSLGLVGVFKETSRYFILLLREAGLKCTTICACTESTDLILRGLYKKYPPVDPVPLLKGLAARCRTF